jgi:hypothetical protein
LIYGENNPVDGAVLEVILRKAQAIEKQTGVRVPMPDEGGSLTKALMSAVLLRAHQRRQGQLALDLDVTTLEESKALDSAWANASENEKKARTIFAQHSLKPDEVISEWDAILRVLGGFPDVERFVSRALARLGTPLQKHSGGGFLAPLGNVPGTLKERFHSADLAEDQPLKVAFEARPRSGYLSIHRAHPLPAILAETFLETALDPMSPANDPATVPRCGGWESDAVERATALLLLRIRHRIDSRGRLGPRFAMAEEAAAIAFDLATGKPAQAGDAAFALLAGESGDLSESVRKSRMQQALSRLDAWAAELDRYAGERADALADDHTRLRRALGSKGAVKVEAVTPVDVIGVYVLMPRI